MALNEKQIYCRLVAALTQRQLPLHLKKVKKASNKLPDTMQLKASVNDSPIYAFSILPVQVKRHELGLKYRETTELPLAYNPPYGILPQLASLDPIQLRKLANHFSVLKFQCQERGNYYHAWLFGWRERMIERVLNNTATLELVKM